MTDFFNGVDRQLAAQV